MKKPEPTTLSGYGVTLAPLSLDHAPALFDAFAGDADTWRWLWTALPRSVDDMAAVVRGVLDQVRAGSQVGFCVVDEARGPVGMTSYLDISAADSRLEIGGTWYARSVWKSHVNPASKLLLLTNAFDELGAERVALKTDHMNTRSQSAIARLGAAREGVLRHHMRRPDGTWRDTVYFSILREEWPAARAGLADRLR